MELEPIPAEVAEAIQKTRRLTVKLAQEVQLHNIEPVDVAIGVAYGLHDLAVMLTGHPVGAVEWLRNAADLFERGHITGGLTVTRLPPRKDGAAH